MTVARPDADDLEALFLTDVPLMDTRAPVEFARGAFPTAVNRPLMNDDERSQVGSCYKQQGQSAAIALGHQLVSGDIRQQRIEAWLQFARANPEGYLYCFRGGMRSAICQQWLAQAGCHYPRVSGGYKAMRRFLIDTTEQFCHQSSLLVLAGHTGAAKTEVLQQVEISVDLEALANHRGSAFGKRPDGQPAQIDFENALAIALLRKTRQWPGRDVVLEDESRLIGRCSLPPQLRQVMQTAPLVVLESDLDARVSHSFENYILNKLHEWQKHLGEEAGFGAFADDLRDSMFRVRKRLGGERYEQLRQQLEQALSAHEKGDPEPHRAWITGLLRDYYDPMYEYQLAGRLERIVFRGDRDSVLAFLASRH